MSLWAIDAGLKAAASNYSGIYLHTREYGVKYNLFDPPESSLTDPVDANLTNWSTGSTYYSALFLVEATNAAGTIVIDLNPNKSETDVDEAIAAYGLYDSVGTRRKLALINYDHDPSLSRSDSYDLAQEASDAYARNFTLPAGVSSTIRYRVLRAPSVWETDRITWAGQTVKDNGSLNNMTDQYTGTLDCTNGCSLMIPGPGAALLMFSDDDVYYGDSTVIRASGNLSNSATGFRISSHRWNSAATAFIAFVLLLR
jgi:hypothetical protein